MTRLVHRLRLAQNETRNSRHGYVAQLGQEMEEKK